ncbi:MAG: hypothetical protein OJF49_001488 [Ktedonobacterales bacterium]|nr:MAG: hypothetical protein OJF49_001488 [Ktedonobacterales bacterium]
MKALWRHQPFLRAQRLRRRGALLPFVPSVLLVGCGQRVLYPHPPPA